MKPSCPLLARMVYDVHRAHIEYWICGAWNTQTVPHALYVCNAKLISPMTLMTWLSIQTFESFIWLQGALSTERNLHFLSPLIVWLFIHSHSREVVMLSPPLYPLMLQGYATSHTLLLELIWLFRLSITGLSFSTHPACFIARYISKGRLTSAPIWIKERELVYNTYLS